MSEKQKLKDMDTMEQNRTKASAGYLRPCPWCGQKPEVTGTHKGTDWVECECGATGPHYHRPRAWRTAAKIAAREWNSYAVVRP